MEKHKKYYFIREKETMDIVVLPSRYLMHKTRSNLSPNTVRKTARSISYYLNYLEYQELDMEAVYAMGYKEQKEHFLEFLVWLKAGLHSREKYTKLPSNRTCNNYLKEIFRFYVFLEHENGSRIKVLSDTQMLVRNSLGIGRVLPQKRFQGYLKEGKSEGRTIEQDKIICLLQECANLRDQVLLLLLAETGFRIGELLGIRYAEDIDYESHLFYVNFREDNANESRAKNAEYRKAKISDATFEIVLMYIEEYKQILIKQDYLFINISGDYKGRPLRSSGVYAIMGRLEKKTGIEVNPHMLRHYFANTRRKAGWKIEIISQALGHRSIETTMRYLNITEDELIEASDNFYRKHQGLYRAEELL